MFTVDIYSKQWRYLEGADCLTVMVLILKIVAEFNLVVYASIVEFNFRNKVEASASHSAIGQSVIM